MTTIDSATVNAYQTEWEATEGSIAVADAEALYPHVASRHLDAFARLLRAICSWSAEPTSAQSMSVCAWLAQTRRRIYEMLELPENWDDQESPPPPREMLDSAFDLMARIMADAYAPPLGTEAWQAEVECGRMPEPGADLPLPTVSPIVGGTMQLEWRTNSRYVEITFVDSTHIILMGREGREYRLFEGSVTELPTVRNYLDWLMRA